MAVIKILLNTEGQFLHRRGKPMVQPDPDTLTIGALPAGMQSGAASINISFEMPDGTWVFLENSMANFIRAAVAFAAKYPDEWRAEGVTLDVTPHPPGRQ